MHTLLGMRAKPGSIVADPFLQLTVAPCFQAFLHHHNPYKSPQAPWSQDRSNTLILVPSFLNLFSDGHWLQATHRKLQIFSCTFYLLSFLYPTATFITSAYICLPGSPLLHQKMPREKHVVSCPIWRCPLLKATSTTLSASSRAPSFVTLTRQ